MKIDIFDTTLRDGFQQEGISPSVKDKLEIAKLLDNLGVSFIEGGWPGASPKEEEFFKKAKSELNLANAKLVSFGSTRKLSLSADKDPQVQALLDADTEYVCIVGKSSKLHITKAIQATVDEAIEMAVDTINYLVQNKKKVFFDAEHFFDGYKEDQETSLKILDAVISTKVECFVFCDTNGGTLPSEVHEIISEIISKYPKANFGVHFQNDNGCAVANSMVAVDLGVNHVQGTINGYGERTGNVDIVTIALNMLTQGIEPELDFSNINSVMREVEYCNQLPVHPRHPYAGDLVFTAFSGSHQDAIKKGFQAIKNSNDPKWEVPYLPIDPADLGRNYEAVVRINSQSGKGGVAFLLEKDHGVSLPRRLQISLSQKIQKLADESGKEISSSEIWDIFEKSYLQPVDNFSYIKHSSSSKQEIHSLELTMNMKNIETLIKGSGNGPIDSFINGLSNEVGVDIKVADYHQSAISSGSDAKAAAYIELENNGKTFWGVGIHPNTTRASFDAIIVGLSKLLKT